MTAIVGYFPLLTYIILILGVTYLLYRNHWMEDERGFRVRSLILLGIVISCSFLNGILLTAPILDGTAVADSLPELLTWIWPDILMLAVLSTDIIRTSGVRVPRE